MTTVPCTVCSGAYWWGAGALANSLYTSGFRGQFWIGYTGAVPAWLLELDRISDREFVVRDDFRIVIHALNEQINVGHQKPDIMLAILDDNDDANKVMLFDADLVTVAPSQFFEEWIAGSVGLVLDALGTPYLYERHPWREAWKKIIDGYGWNARPLTQYFGSAFCGFERNNRQFAERWKIIISEMQRRYPESLGGVRMHSRAHPFHLVDQDAMNAAAMATDCPLAVIGNEGFGVGQHSYLMQHPRLHQKPWDFSYIKRALKGWGPADPYELLFLTHCRGVINLLSEREQRRQIQRLKIGRVIHRVYRIT